MSAINNKPWYSHTSVWVLFLIPFSAVLFGMVMIATVQIFPDDTVSDNYYKEGMAINKRFEEDSRNQISRIQVGVYALENQLIGFDSIPPTDSEVYLNLHHIADSSKDLRVVLSRDLAGAYYSMDSQVYDNLTSSGIWYLEFNSAVEQWKINKRLATPVNLFKGQKR